MTVITVPFVLFYMLKDGQRLVPNIGQVRERVDQSLDGAVIGQCHGSPLLGFHKIRDYAVLTIVRRTRPQERSPTRRPHAPTRT